MLEGIFPAEVVQEASPVLAVLHPPPPSSSPSSSQAQQQTPAFTELRDRFIHALHTVSLDQQSSGGGGPLGTGSGSTNLNGIQNLPFKFLPQTVTQTQAGAPVFPSKKPPHPQKKATDGGRITYTVQGLLKNNWIEKHVNHLPSACIYLAPFDGSWSAAEWAQREQALFQDLERLRQQVEARDVRIFILLVKPSPPPAPSGEDSRIYEERLMSFRRRAPPAFEANKMVYLLNDPQDLLPTSLAMRRLYKHVRDLSSGYYFLHCKRVKRWETSLNRHAQLPLIIRYRFKQALWYEFMGHGEKAMKHYAKTFEALQEMQAGLTSPSSVGGPSTSSSLGLSTSGAGGGGYTSTPSSISAASSGASSYMTAGGGGNAGYQLSNAHLLGGWVSQIKALAEVVSFKICYYSMREAQHGQALAQFRRLMQTWAWKKRAGRPAIASSSSSTAAWRGGGGVGGGGGNTHMLNSTREESSSFTPRTQQHHRLDFLLHEWVARQYQIFADLLQAFPSPPTSLTTGGGGSGGGGDIDSYMDPDHYFFNAALYAIKQRTVAAFLQANPWEHSKYAARLAVNLGLEGPLLVAPLYLGGRPRLVDPSIEEGRPEADLIELIQLILERDEALKVTTGTQSEVVRRLLGAAVAFYDPSRPGRPRFKGLQYLQLADEMVGAGMWGEAWRYYCGALRRYGEERDGGRWSVPTVVVLVRMRQCALSLGKQAHYMDLTLKLLGQGLRSAVGGEERRVFFLEALYLLSGLQPPPELLSGTGSGGGRSLFNCAETGLFAAAAAGQGGGAGGEGGPVTYDEGGKNDASSSFSSTLSTSPLTVEPMVTLLPDAIEVALECGARQLVSFSVSFPEATVAMGGSCPFRLRIISHLPLPLHLSKLSVRFNKDYMGTIDVGEGGKQLSALERLRDSFRLLQQQQQMQQAQGKQQQYVEVDENKVARVSTPLLLQPDMPLDLDLTMLVPTHELVEIGDMVHAVQLQLHVDVDAAVAGAASSSSPLPCGAKPWKKPFSFTLPSGVAYLESLGVTTANVCKYGSAVAPPGSPDALISAQLSSLPVPLQATVRGFPTVEVIRPTARASLGLSYEKEEAEALVSTLVGHMHCLWVKVESHEDSLLSPMLYVRSDPAPLSGRAEDALFFNAAGGGGGGGSQHTQLVPLKLGKDLQPEAALPVSVAGKGTTKNLPPQSSVMMPVWVRTLQEGRIKVNMVLVYHAASSSTTSPTATTSAWRGGTGGTASTATAAAAAAAEADQFSNLMVSKEFIFDLESHAPFLTSFDVASPRPAALPNMHLPPAALQEEGNDDGAAAAAAYTFYTGEQVRMRLSIKALQPAAWGEGQGEGRPRIEKVVWHPEEDVAKAVPGVCVQEESENAPGLVLYSLAQEGGGGGVGVGVGDREEQHQHHKKQLEKGMHPQDVLSLSFPFLCPDKESTHGIPLGKIRLFWSIVPTSTTATTTTAASPSISWVSCTEVDCPTVRAIKPDVAVSLRAPLEARMGQSFKLQWTLQNLAGRVLSLRVMVTEGVTAGAGPSTEEALAWAGTRESVVQILPDETLHLPYRVVPLLTGPIALPRLVLKALPDSGSSGDAAAATAAAPGVPAITTSSLPLRVSYRYVDNVLANASNLPSTPSSARASGAGDDNNRGRGTEQQLGPADTRHIFVLPVSEGLQQ